MHMAGDLSETSTSTSTSVLINAFSASGRGYFVRCFKQWTQLSDHVLSIYGDGGIEKSHPCKLG